MRRSHVFYIVAFALLVGGGGGCGHQVRSAGGVDTIYFGSGTYFGVVAVPLAIVLIMIAVAVVGGRGGKAAAAAVIAVVALFSLAVLPGIWIDRVTLDAQGVTQHTGFWWSQTVKGFKTAEVREIRILRKPSGPENRLQTVWEIHRKSGGTQDIDPGDLWDNGTDYLVPKLRERGITVQDLR
jgi:hypothetical protein